MTNAERWLFVFFITSYIAWQYYFSIARYLAALEMLAPLIIYLLVKQLVKRPYWRFFSLFAIFYMLLATLSPIPMVRARWYDTPFFNVKMPRIITTTPKATVLIAYTTYASGRDPRPQAYLIPFFPKAWQFIGIPFSNRRYMASDALSKQIQSVLDKTHPIYLLTSEADMPALVQAAAQFNLRPAGACETITSDRQRVTTLAVLICPVMRNPLLNKH